MTPDAPAEKRIRLMCVDDNDQIRFIFELLMREQPEFEVLPSLETANNLLEVIPQQRPDVVVLDLSIPGCDSMQVMSQARTQFPSVRFLIASAYEDEARIETAFRAGATGYFLKLGDFEKMAEAIRKVAVGEIVKPNSSMPLA